eukprot:6464133-Amphidinium_carterae.1
MEVALSCAASGIARECGCIIDVGLTGKGDDAKARLHSVAAAGCVVASTKRLSKMGIWRVNAVLWTQLATGTLYVDCTERATGENHPRDIADHGELDLPDTNNAPWFACPRTHNGLGMGTWDLMSEQYPPVVNASPPAAARHLEH